MPPAARARAVIGALLVAVLLAGCSGDDGDGDAGPASTDEPAASGELVEGGTVRLGLGGPVVADPVLANLGSPSDLMVLDLLHDGLTRTDADGEVQPALALEWSADPTLTTWTFTLDGTATFTDGRGLTAADVVVSVERIAKGGDSSLAALRLETIAGFREFVSGAAPNLAGLTAPDPLTVQVALSTPMSVLPQILASPVYGVIDAASLAEATAPSGDLGDLDLSGGWAVEEESDQGTRLVRREDADAHLDAVELHAYDTPVDAYDAFDDGEVDWALVPVDRYGDAVDEHGDDAFTPFHAELFFGMRVSSPALSRVEVRKAIRASIDREAIVRAVYADLAEPLTTVIPEGVPGHSRDRCAECRFDLDEARAILAAAFPSGGIPTVAIDYDQSPAQEAMASIIADGLGAVGIPTQLRPKPLDEYKAFVVSGAQELFSFGWIGGYASADAYLAPLFGSVADDNLTGFGAADVDAALAGARATLDPAAAAAGWVTVETRVLTDAVVVPIAQFRTQAVLGERVEAWEAAVDGAVDWSAVWVRDGD